MTVMLLLLLWLLYCLPVAEGIDASTGGTVTLPCDGPVDTDTKEVTVQWLFGHWLTFWFKNGTWCETLHHANRTRLASIQQKNFSLVIDPVRKDDNGIYTCKINNKNIRSIRLNVVGSQTDVEPHLKQRDARIPPRGLCRFNVKDTVPPRRVLCRLNVNGAVNLRGRSLEV